MPTRLPARADHVGSLLRSQAVRDARAQCLAGRIDAAQLHTIEDREIASLIRRQEEIGLGSVTDGEIRRAWWHFDFLAGLEGVELVEAEQGIQFAGVQTKAQALRVTGRLGFADHPMVEHFRFVQQHATGTPKISIPSPSMLHYRGGRKMVDDGVHPDMDAFFADLGEAYRQAVQAFAKAGCRYLQLDDVSFAYFCDPAQHEMLRERGDDPERLPSIYAGMINAALRDRPSDMLIAMHACRGNFRSTFVASGGYEPVAELLFNGIDVDAYFLEWDTDRAGGFEPLRFLPKGKTVVLGLVTSKHGGLEAPDALKLRIDEAAKFAPLDQLCLSPQCGFSSTEEGNTLTEDEQWDKLRLVASVARDVWGSA